MSFKGFTYKRTSRYLYLQIKRTGESMKSIIMKPNTAKNVEDVRSHLNQLTTEYDEFKQCVKRGFTTIDESLKPDDVKKLEEMIIADSDKVKKYVLSLIGDANLFISEFEGGKTRESLSNTTLNSSAVGIAEPNVKLPRINVPTFDGTFEDFFEFNALFQNVIHDEASISKVRKLYYLKQALTCDALALVKDIPITDRGYDEAWSLIQSTYKDVKKIIRKHLDHLFSIAPIKNSDEIASLLSKVNRSLKGLKACGEDVENWSTFLSYLVSEKLDKQTYYDFEKTLTTNTKFPSWKTLRVFLENRSSITKRQVDLHVTKPNRNLDSSSKRAVLTATKPESKFKAKSFQSSTKPICVCCSKYHLLIDCEEFKSKSPKQCYELLKTKQICRNCFKSNHRTSKCNRQGGCKHCNLPHHTLLHFDAESHTVSNELPKATVSESNPSTPNTNSTVASCVSTEDVIALISIKKPIVMLPTAVVKFACGDKTGDMHVLLDSASQMNLVTSEFVNRNNLICYKNAFVQKVGGINNSDQFCDKSISVRIESKTQPFSFNTELSVISSKIPYRVIDADCSLNDLTGYKLADPAYYKSLINIPKIDAILGVEIYNACVKSNKKQISDLCLRDTYFGWVISSTLNSELINSKATSLSVASTFCCSVSVDRIDERLRLFWETEEIAPDKSHCTEADLCNSHFEKTYSRNEGNKFVVRLPFKRDPSVILGNYQIAFNHHNHIQKRLTSNDQVAVLYRNFMSEYLNLNHMTRVPYADISSRYFIPHHAVMKLTSTTTKLRTVFNASSKAPSGFFLNDVLMNGPVLQPELFDILLRIRTFPYVVTGDVEKMYRCALVHPDDRRFQSIIWDDKIYELNTITYGTGPATFMATKCLDELAKEIEPIDPAVAFIIRNCMYMDDLMMGGDTIETVIRQRETVHKILASASFILCKLSIEFN